MSSIEKVERRRSADSASAKLSKSQSLERRSRTSSGSRRLSKKISTECGKSQEPPAKRINYADEVVLIFYDFLLKGIVQKWIPTVEEIKKHEVKNEDDDVQIKDFKELTAEDLESSQVVAAKASQVSLTKKQRTLSNLATDKSLTRVKSRSKQLLGEGDTASVSSKGRKKASEKFDRHKRKHKNQLMDQFSSTTFNTRSEEMDTTRDSKEWLLKTMDENVTIIFKNGNIYEGKVHRKAMHGYGKFWWADGAYYQGDFLNGSITGKGKMVLPDLSYYRGDFYEGLFHGNGVFCVSNSSMLYSGGWKFGKKHETGWLLYGPNNWYDGEWFEGKRHGFGIRRYASGAVYEGMWEDNVQSGEGSIAWHNNDFYKGSWKGGIQHGYGEYTWNAFFNKTLTFPILNTYQGSWADGMRNGIGKMQYGFTEVEHYQRGYTKPAD